ncbi:MAG TPA: hypothetical protein PKE12_12335 [Kiritimatiellia bacterium]|nr:hypothetical protein [Kiritimatiellia bacterium]
MHPACQCPLCHAAIALDDVNVATDIALCRACGKTFSFSLARGASELGAVDFETPPRGLRAGVNEEGGIELRYRRLSPALLFLIPFTAVWSGFSMWGIYGTQIARREFDLGQSLFGIPFLLGTIVLLGVIAFMLAGHWRVTLWKGGGTVFAGIGRLGWTRAFDYGPTSLVSLRVVPARGDSGPQTHIVVRTEGGDFAFGATIRDDAKRYIAAAIQREASRS